MVIFGGLVFILTILFCMVLGKHLLGYPAGPLIFGVAGFFLGAMALVAVTEPTEFRRMIRSYRDRNRSE